MGSVRSEGGDAGRGGFRGRLGWGRDRGEGEEFGISLIGFCFYRDLHLLLIYLCALWVLRWV